MSKMHKIEFRIEDLDETVAHYMDKVEKLEESQREFDKETKNYIRKCVLESLHSCLNSKHQEIITKINDNILNDGLEVVNKEDSYRSFVSFDTLIRGMEKK